MIGFRNLNAHVKGLINGSYPDIGQVFYMVDSNYRTAAQGWSNAQGTGPLDLFAAYGDGAETYVYYAPGTQPSGVTYATDRAAIQAMIDAQTDFRGDIGFFTPGAYSLATTALAFNVPNARYLGPPVANPKRSVVTLTDAIGDNAVSVDNVEFGFLRFVPLTAQNWFQIANGADGGYIHDSFYDADGITADTATEFIATAATTEEWLVERVTSFVDAAQGSFAALIGANWWKFSDCEFIVDGGTWASVITFLTTASQGCQVLGSRTVAAGASSLITNVFTGMAGANMLKVLDFRMDGTATPTAGNIETGFDATTGIELAECYITGDATTQGGLLIVLT